jgi:DNA-binding IclR family transcriptional regulator
VAERRDDLHDIQALSDTDAAVYEAVASCAVDEVPARLAEIVEMTDMAEDVVRRSLAVLVERGWLLTRGDAYVVGPHDWGLEY